MRTTLDIDEDILLPPKMARDDVNLLGKVLSEFSTGRPRFAHMSLETDAQSASLSSRRATRPSW